MGYHRAGFDVTGVDIAAQPHYPFRFVQGDALAYLAEHGHEFDAIHASPPCQAYSVTRHLPRTGGHPALVEVTRAALIAAGRPWIMENVPGAPMPAAVMLCGTMFGLGAECPGGWRQLRRHRLFEHDPGVPLWPPYTCQHSGRSIGVYGHGANGLGRRGFAGDAAQSAAALGISWMTRDGLSQAIPPAYTEYIGAELIRHAAPALTSHAADVSAANVPGTAKTPPLAGGGA
jgi:DNA (cytosine-5)-methyltransferase 1